METPLTYALTLLARIVSAILKRREKPEAPPPGMPPARRETEAGWVRGGSLYRYVGRASTITVTLPSLYTQEAAEDKGPGGIASYLTWADMVSPNFSRTLINQIRALKGERGARQG